MTTDHRTGLTEYRQRVPSCASDNSLAVRNRNDELRDQRTQSSISSRPPAIIQRTKHFSTTDG